MICQKDLVSNKMYQYLHIKMNINTAILFSFEIIKVGIVSNYNEQQHVLLQQQAQNRYQVIKNGIAIRTLFEYFESHGIMPICYSTKKTKHTRPYLQKLHPNLLWIYLQSNSPGHQQLRPNHAQLEKIQGNNYCIAYGEGFSACEGKEEIRIAICSAIGIGLEQSRSIFLIFEDSQSEIKRLNDSGYANVYKGVPDRNIIQSWLHINDMYRCQKTDVANNKQYEQLVQGSPSLDDPKYVEKIKQFIYFENKKNITVPVSLGLLNQSSNSPVSIFRLPKSMSVCAIVFKYLGDKQNYVGKSDVTVKLGGDVYHESLQNRILASCIYQFLINTIKNSTVSCLPHYLSKFNMRHSIIKSYNKSQAQFIVRPFILGLKTIAEQFQKQNFKSKEEEAIKFIKSGTFSGKRVRGLGTLIGISLLTGAHMQKGLLQTIALSKTSNKEQYNCCKIDIQDSFSSQIQEQTIKCPSQSLLDKPIKLLSSPGTYLPLKQVCQQYLVQLKQQIQLICQIYPIFESIFTHYSWSYNKLQQLDSFVRLLTVYRKAFGLGTLQTMQQNNKNLNMDLSADTEDFIQNEGIQPPNCKKIKTFSLRDSLKKQARLDRMNPKLLNYIISSSPQEKFETFTKVQIKQSQFSFTADSINPYQQKFMQLENFIIYGISTPVHSLIRWIKCSFNAYSQIMYLSLLFTKPETYVKYMKQAKMDKRNVLFILDHCEIQEAGGQLPQGKTIADSNWGLRTVFLYRLKLGGCKKLKIMHDPFSSVFSNQSSICKQSLGQTSQQLFKTIIGYLPMPKTKRFASYAKILGLYIQHKWLTIGKRLGFSIDIIYDKLRMLVSAISKGKNRLIVILNSKEFNDTSKKYYQEYRLMKNQLQTERDNCNMEQTQRLSQVQSFSIQKILYMLPIFIVNQKVWLMHDIHQYLSAYFLYIQLLNNSWKGGFEGEQLKNFQFWFKELQDQEQHKIRNNIKSMLEQFGRQKANKGGGGWVMGEDSFGDCLELARKIGTEQLFCKMDKIFQFDGYTQQILRVQSKDQSNKLLIITSVGSVHSIQRKQQIKIEKQRQKTIQNETLLQKKLQIEAAQCIYYQESHKQLEKTKEDTNMLLYKYAGSSYSEHNSVRDIFIYHAYCFCSDKSYIFEENMLKLKQKHIQQQIGTSNQSSQEQPKDPQKDQIGLEKGVNVKVQSYDIKIDISPIVQYQKKVTGNNFQILKLKVIQGKYIIIISKSGQIFIASYSVKLTENSQKQLVWVVDNFIYVENLPWYIKNSKVQQQDQYKNCKYLFQYKDCNAISDNIIIQHHLSKQYIKIVIAIPNESLNKQRSDTPIIKGYPIGVIQLQLKSQQNKDPNSAQKLQIRRSICSVASSQFKVKNLGISIQEQGVELLVFQNGTDALLLWVLPQYNKDAKNYYLLGGPHHKFYLVQNDPVYSFKSGSFLYIGSKYKFIKKLRIKQDAKSIVNKGPNLGLNEDCIMRNNHEHKMMVVSD